MVASGETKALYSLLDCLVSYMLDEVVRHTSVMPFLTA